MTGDNMDKSKDGDQPDTQHNQTDEKNSVSGSEKSEKRAANRKDAKDTNATNANTTQRDSKSDSKKLSDLLNKKVPLQKNNKGRNRPPRKKNTSGIINLLLWGGILLLFFSFVYKSYFTDAPKETTTSGVVKGIKDDQVHQIIVRGANVEIKNNDGTTSKTRRDTIAGLDETLSNFGVPLSEHSNVQFSVEREKGFFFWLKSFLPFLFPLLLFLLFFWFLSRQTKGMGGMQVFPFGKSRARFVDPNDKTGRVTFKDVAGATEAKEELEEFVSFLKNPDKFLKIGAKIPKGVLLTGEPGTGKTLLARAVAGEAGVPFFSISGSEFVEVFVGVGASRVRDLFAAAKKESPAIVFIDEIDAVGRVRGSGVGGGNDEREQALNQILVEMDGFEQTDKVVVLASTNRPDILDNALLRPGRFDRKIVVGLPDIKERASIIKVHMRQKKLDDSVNVDVIARRTPGLSGADLASIVNEAAILAVRNKRNIITQKDLLEAIEKVMMGPERKGRVITKHERSVIAYHEAGHALLASLLPYADPVQKITIISRGHAGGYVLSVPDADRRLKTKREFIDTITVALGGYTAEQLIFGDISTGPASDLIEASRVAHSMVTRFGMSDEVGPIVLRQPDARGFGGREGHSQELEKQIDSEVNKIVKDAHKQAEELLRENRSALDLIVEKLFEHETLEREEYEAVLKEHGIEIQNAFADE